MTFFQHYLERSVEGVGRELCQDVELWGEVGHTVTFHELGKTFIQP